MINVLLPAPGLVWSGMGVSTETRSQLAGKFAVLLPHLDERQRRLAIGAEARALGHGGIQAVAQAAGVSEATVSKGVADLESGRPPLGRVRRAGGGRKRVADPDPGLRPAILALVEPDVRGESNAAVQCDDQRRACGKICWRVLVHRQVARVGTETGDLLERPVGRRGRRGGGDGAQARGEDAEHDAHRDVPEGPSRD